jgi:excisionase family DNA binding protein
MRAEAIKLPTTAVSQAAKEALRTLAPAGERDEPAVVRVQSEGGPTEASVAVPHEAFQILLDALGQLALGNAVKVVPVHAELTTHQAAELLNVSRPYLIVLLDAGKIPHRRVGTHRRIRFTDLMAYKKQDDAVRDAAVAELTRQAEDLGLGY